MGDRVRLNKYLSEAGVCSRRKADEWIQAGRVYVNRVTAQMGMQVSDEDEIVVNGQRICRQQKLELIAFYKPKGYACTAYRGDESNIFHNFNLDPHLKYIGRLDKDSEGLLLLTNDGDLCNEIAKARNQHEKEYVVTVNRSLTDDFLKGMANGVRIHDSNKDQWVVTRPCKVQKKNDKTFSIVLTQGLNRQIRKMCDHYGYKVVKLRRIRVMNILLEGMKPGEIRTVSEAEFTQLQKRIENGKFQTE